MGELAEDRPRYVPIEKFGRDHWSVFGYLETRIVDHKGVVDIRKMRCDPHRHLQFAHVKWSKDYPTFLKGGETVTPHDDWDCVEDLVEAGLVFWNGTGLYPVFALTEQGLLVSAFLRRHKMEGGHFESFKWP